MDSTGRQTDREGNAKESQHTMNERRRRRCMPVAVVVEFVVTGKSQESPESWSEREEDLSRSINPYLMVIFIVRSSRLTSSRKIE